MFVLANGSSVYRGQTAVCLASLSVPSILISSTLAMRALPETVESVKYTFSTGSGNILLIFYLGEKSVYS